MAQAERFVRRHRGALIRIVAIGLGLLSWHVAASRSAVIRDHVASPDTVMRAAAALAFSGELARHGWVSLQELALGFGLAAASGVSIGFAMGGSRVLSGLLDPLVMAFNVTPRVALLPILVVGLGVGMASKVAAVFLGALFPIVVNTQAGVRHVHLLWVQATRAFGARPDQVVVKVLLPATLPAVMAGLRLGFGRGVVGLIVAELYVSLAGVGQLLQLYGNAGRTAELIALTTLVALGGTIGVVGLAWLEARLSRWRRDLEA